MGKQVQLQWWSQTSILFLSSCRQHCRKGPSFKRCVILLVRRAVLSSCRQRQCRGPSFKRCVILLIRRAGSSSCRQRWRRGPLLSAVWFFSSDGRFQVHADNVDTEVPCSSAVQFFWAGCMWIVCQCERNEEEDSSCFVLFWREARVDMIHFRMPKSRSGTDQIPKMLYNSHTCWSIISTSLSQLPNMTSMLDMDITIFPPCKFRRVSHRGIVSPQM